MRKYIFLFVLFVGSSFSLNAQVYAYCNGGNLVEAMAAKEKTDDVLTAFQAPLIKEGQDMVIALKTKEKKLYEDIEKGLLSQIAIQKRQEELNVDATALQTFEKNVSDKIKAKRQELLNPLLEKVQTAIDDVAKAKSYKLVFDESMIGGILYGDKSLDITADVKAKLGL